MWLTVGILGTKVARATDDEQFWLSEYLTFRDASAFFRGVKTDKVNLYNTHRGTFPTGLLPLVMKAAPEKGFAIELVDKRVKPCERDPHADLAWLRDYQLEAVDAACKPENGGRGILHMTTGAGKTEVAVALTRALPCRWLLLVHRSTLMDQAAARYELRSPGLRAGRVGDGKWDVPDDATFVCATFQTISRLVEKGDKRALDLLQNAQGLFIDEAHTLPANSFYRVVEQCVNAYYRIGLSGSPLARGDRRSLFTIAALGPVIYRVKPERLIAAGVLAKAQIRLIRCRQQSDEATWQGVYGKAVVRSARRNKLLVEACKRAEKPCLMFIKEIPHGKALEKQLLKAGLSARFIYGNANLDARKRSQRDLVAGRHDVLICSVIFQEGEDIPELRSVVIGSAGKSVIAALQRIGRGMRISKDKTTFEVFDIADYGCDCMATGTPKEMQHAGCRWLENHTRGRIKAYVAEGHQTAVEDWVGSELPPGGDAGPDLSRLPP